MAKPFISARWTIALVVTAAIAVSYFDRQTLPVAIRAIQRDIPLSNEQFSWLNSAFLVAYALMYAGGGRLLDVLGTRRGFTLIMVWWSLACASHGLATSVVALGTSRILLGLGEGGGFPAATKAVAECFPVTERSRAMGLINAGTAVGAVAAPPLIAIVIWWWSWRMVFVLAGAIGLVWTLWWLRTSVALPGQPRRTEASSDLASEASPRWRELAWRRDVLGLVAAKFLSDAAWYFYLFWLPKYLYDVRGFDTKSVGAFGWIPYAAAGLGCLAGGWLSSDLLRRGQTLDRARKIALGASAAVMPLIVFVTGVPVGLAIVLFSIAFFGQQSWSTIVMVIPADIVPPRAVGTVAGLVGFGGAMGGVVFGLIVGWMLDHGVGYPVVFGLVSSFHVLAFIVILATVRIAPARTPQAALHE